MFSSSLNMIKIERNMSQLWQNVCKKYNINISKFVGFMNTNNFKNDYKRRTNFGVGGPTDCLSNRHEV